LDITSFRRHLSLSTFKQCRITSWEIRGASFRDCHAYCSGDSFLWGTAHIVIGGSIDRTFILCCISRGRLLARKKKAIVSIEAPPDNGMQLTRIQRLFYLQSPVRAADAER
jgi:hypothetical protein